MTIEKQAMNWYTVKVQTQREKSISERLKIEMKREFKEDVNVMVPIKKVLVLNKEGKKIPKETPVYPGYVFVETIYPDKLNHVVKFTVGATNVLSDNKKKPIILRQSEVDRMIGFNKEGERGIIKEIYIPGEPVTVLEGAFTNFSGVIESVDNDKNKVRVEILIFGRKNHVDLTLDDITKTNG